MAVTAVVVAAAVAVVADAAAMVAFAGLLISHLDTDEQPLRESPTECYRRYLVFQIGTEVKSETQNETGGSHFEKERRNMTLPPPLYYFAAGTDSGCLCGCDHFHLTVASAVACTSMAAAGAYVIAVEKGEYRELDPKEEKEFQELMYGSPERKLEGKILGWPKPEPEPTD